MPTVISLTGLTGFSYEFSAFDYHDKWNHVGGIYAFAGRDAQGVWHVYYIGETDSFAKRMCNHEKWPPAVLMGATHVLALVSVVAPYRKASEEELIRFYKPPLNDHYSDARSLGDILADALKHRKTGSGGW